MRAASPSRSLLSRVVGVVALASFVQCAAAPPPPDFLYGPAYGGSDPLASPSPGARATQSASIASADVVIGRIVLARSIARALATDGVNIYFGDEEQNALMMVPGAGGATANLIERPAPLELALDGRAIAWIGNRGSVVRRVPRAGAPATTIRDRGSFTAIAASRGETFVAEDAAKGSILLRVNGSSVTQIGAFDVAVRAIAMDDTHAYVVTASEVLRLPRGGGDIVKLASGSDLAHAQLDRDSLYVTAKVSSSRAILRVPKGGGDAAELAHDVRQAPIAIFGNDLYFFDDSKPELRRIPSSGGAPVLAGRDEAFLRVAALVVDQLRITVATDVGVITLARAR
jgi:hypothetical protein